MRGWRDMSSCPRAADGKSRVVLVWHVYQMCMVYDCEKARRNRFVVRWQEIPDEWIQLSERPPESRDANPLGVVIVKDRHGDIRLRGWHQTNRESGVTEWMPTPDAPDDYLQLRESADMADAQGRIENYDISQHHEKRRQRY